MRLNEARKLFNELREHGKITLSLHVKNDHKERLFNEKEIIYLIQHTKGKLVDNNKSPTATKGSFLYLCNDLSGRDVQAGVILKDDILVIHIFRRV